MDYLCSSIVLSMFCLRTRARAHMTIRFYVHTHTFCTPIYDTMMCMNSNELKRDLCAYQHLHGKPITKFVFTYREMQPTEWQMGHEIAEQFK